MSTIYTIFSKAADGYLTSSASTYADSRDGTGSITTQASADDTIEGQHRISDSDWRTYQSFFVFDTNSIPSGVAQTANLISLYVDIVSTSGKRFAASEPLITNAFLLPTDFVAGGDLSALPQGSDLEVITADRFTYKEFSITTDITRATNYWVMIFPKDQADNLAPTGEETVRFNSANEAGTSLDPFLTIELADPPEADLAITLGQIAMASTSSAPAIATGTSAISNVEIASTAIEATPAALAITLDDIAASVGSESSFEGSTPARRRLALSASLQAGRTLSFARGA